MEFGEIMAEVWTVWLMSHADHPTIPLIETESMATYLPPGLCYPFVGLVKMDGDIGIMEY